MVISSQKFDPLKRHSNATKGTNSRLGWTKYIDLHEIVHSSLRQPCVIRSSSNYHYGNDNVKKQFVLRAKQLLCTCITLLSTFLWRPLQVRRETSQLSPLYLNGDKVVKNSTQRKLAYINWWIARFQKWSFHCRRSRCCLRSLCVIRGAKCGEGPSEIQAALNLGVTTLKQNGAFCLHTIEHIKQH